MTTPEPLSPTQRSVSSSNSGRLPDPILPYGLHGLGSTASLVGILKAAALNPFENLDDVSADDPEPWSPGLNLDDSDDGSNTSETLLTPTRHNHHHHQSLICGPSELGYPTRAHLDDLARDLIGQQTRCAELTIQKSQPNSADVSQSSSPKGDTPAGSPHPPQSSKPPDPKVSLVNLTPQADQTLSDEGALDLSPSDRLRLLVEQFGPWTGLDAHGEVESETYITQIPGVLYCSVIVQGVILLTNRRVCYLAYLPMIDKGKVIRSGTATYKSGARFFNRQRRWIELRTDSLTDYRSSTKLFRPISSLHLSKIKRVLPISPDDPKTFSLRLMDDELIHLEFDTLEATNEWYNSLVSAIFNLKTHYSNQIKLSLPLRRIRKLHRERFENIAKMMTFELADGTEALGGCLDEMDLCPERQHNRVKLAYLSSHDPFDEKILDTIVHAKMEIISSSAGSSTSTANQTPSPVFEVLEPIDPESENDGDDSKLTEKVTQDPNANSDELTKGFLKAFGLEVNQKLYICPCSLVRTIPAFGHMAISDAYFCFWRPVVVIGQDLKLRIPLIDIGLVKESTAFGFTRFGLAMEIAGAADIRLDFSSQSLRDETMTIIKLAVDGARAAGARAMRRQSSLPSPTPLAQMPRSPDIPLSHSQIKVLPAMIGTHQMNRTVAPLRIVCMTIGSRGDVQPYISLAKRLMQDGHTVTIASHPEYRKWVESFGILYKDVGGDPAALMKLSVEHAFFTPSFFKEGLQNFRKWLDDLFMEAWQACKESDVQVLIESPSTFSGIHIAEALRIPYFRAFTMTWTSTSTYPQAFAASMDLGPTYNLLSYTLFDNLIWRAMAGQVNRWRKNTLGLPSTTLEKQQPYKVPFLYNFSSAVVPKPLDWRDHVDVTGYWFLDQSQGTYEPPVALTKFISSARADGVPLIYVGFGSITVPDSTAVTKAIYGAVVQAGVRAVVAKGWSERAQVHSVDSIPIEVPAEVYVLESIPHDWLFPQIDAVCHHGGAGTTGISLRFGLPTLIHPFFGDQMFWADRVNRLGAGMRVDTLSTHCLTEAFVKATKDRVMKEKAGQVGERIRAEDGPSRAVEFIYRYLDFALERTEHRIQRTAPKRSKILVGSPTEKTLATLDEASKQPKLAPDRAENVLTSTPGHLSPMPSQELSKDNMKLDNLGGDVQTRSKKKSSGSGSHSHRKLWPGSGFGVSNIHSPSLGKIKELLMSVKFLVRISSSSPSSRQRAGNASSDGSKDSQGPKVEV